MSKNLSSYPLPPSMTPERPAAVASAGTFGGNVHEGISLSESWARRLAALKPPEGVGGKNGEDGEAPRRTSSSGNGDYRPPATAGPRSASPPRRAPFDIEQQQRRSGAAPTKRTSPTSFLRDFIKKPSSSFEFLSKKPSPSFGNLAIEGAHNAHVQSSPLPSTPASANDEGGFQSSSASSSLATPQSPQSPPSPSMTPELSSAYALQSRRYKGFSTPFCGLFTTSGGLPTADHLNPQLHRQEDPHHHRREIQLAHLRTDLCSLPCFGILQYDYTRYLFTHTRPPTLCKRMCFHFLIPFAMFLVAGYCAGNIRNEYANSVVCTALVYCIFIWIVSGCVRGRKKRVMVREEILWRLRRREEKVKKRMEQRALGRNHAAAGAPADRLINEIESEEYEYYSEDEYEYHKTGYANLLGQTRFEMNCAHRMFGCYPSDIPRDSCCSNGSEADDYILQGQQHHVSQNDNPDLCSKIWSLFARPCLPCMPCCNGSHGFHPQFCGLCALAQEAREANLTLPRHLRMVDYITMEPFLLYYPRIMELRRSATSSFWEHCQALSALSRSLLVSFKVVLVALSIVGVSNAFGYWDLKDMAVLLTTFLQSFAVMYCVHWWQHRYDLSIDAVIKYFSCGFVLCTGMAFTVELLEYLAFQSLVKGVVWWLDVGVVDSNGYGGGSMHSLVSNGQPRGRYLVMGSDILDGFLKRNPTARLFYNLVSSYAMAGLVEEVCKYFGFVMVDHPDFCSEREMEKAKATMPLQILRDREEEEDDDEESAKDEKDGADVPPSSEKMDEFQLEVDAALASFNPAMQRRSLSSIRSGVTVAMVAVALGFACCENLLHIFIYNRSSLRSEIMTLIVKSLFPLHPISAAIQSIFVCRRDLEKDSSIGLGQIVLPSVVFHGTFDFALFIITSSWQRSHSEQYFNQGGSVTGVAIMGFFASSLIVLAGIVYYLFSSRAQYARLRGDSGNGDTSALSEASFGLLL